jgi:hypothetical protein
MIDQAKEKEKNLLKDLNRANSNIINTGIEEEVKKCKFFNYNFDSVAKCYFLIHA